MEHARFNFIYLPGSDLYVVYDEVRRDTLGLEEFGITSSSSSSPICSLDSRAVGKTGVNFESHRRSEGPVYWARSLRASGSASYNLVNASRM